MLNGYSATLLAALRHALRRWDCDLSGDHVTFTKPGGTYRPLRRAPSWQWLLGQMQGTCAQHGISRARLLPLRGLQDAELTFSAVQALDPYLKHREPHTYDSGFFPQPVVRFTGKRDNVGALRPGFATAFANTSVVQPISSVEEHGALIDSWISVLSRLGLHAHHTTISGSLRVWNRPPVRGITLRFEHGGVVSGDAVLVWNAKDPAFVGSDIGSGLERLRWILSGRPWPQVLFGELADHGDFGLLDAVRTATLIAGSGVTPAPQGAGSAIRRILRAVSVPHRGLGMSRLVRWSHRYWTLFGPLPVPWPEVCRVIDDEVFGGHKPGI